MLHLRRAPLHRHTEFSRFESVDLSLVRLLQGSKPLEQSRHGAHAETTVCRSKTQDVRLTVIGREVLGSAAQRLVKGCRTVRFARSAVTGQLCHLLWIADVTNLIDASRRDDYDSEATPDLNQDHALPLR